MAASTAITAGATLASGAASAGASLYGSSQASSASKASAYYTAMQNQVNQNNLTPWRGWGEWALPGMADLSSGAPAGTNYLNYAQQYYGQAAQNLPSQVLTQQGLEQTPGYQFTQQQGLKAAQASAAARGLGVSGASLKGAATYATGLADATYANRFNEAQTNYQDIMNQGAAQQNLGTFAQSMQQQQYNQYSGLATLGENAAAQSGTTSTQAAANTANYLNQSGQAQAAGTTGAANALTSGVNNYLSYSALQSAIAGAQSGGTSGISQLTNPNLTWDPSTLQSAMGLSSNQLVP